MREIHIEEMPQGCVLSIKSVEIVVSSKEDAEAIIESLKKMIYIQYSEATPNCKCNKYQLENYGCQCGATSSGG